MVVSSSVTFKSESNQNILFRDVSNVTINLIKTVTITNVKEQVRLLQGVISYSDSSSILLLWCLKCTLFVVKYTSKRIFEILSAY